MIKFVSTVLRRTWFLSAPFRFPLSGSDDKCPATHRLLVYGQHTGRRRFDPDRYSVWRERGTTGRRDSRLVVEWKLGFELNYLPYYPGGVSWLTSSNLLTNTNNITITGIAVGFRNVYWPEADARVRGTVSPSSSSLNTLATEPARMRTQWWTRMRTEIVINMTGKMRCLLWTRNQFISLRWESKIKQTTRTRRTADSRGFNADPSARIFMASSSPSLSPPLTEVRNNCDTERSIEKKFGGFWEEGVKSGATEMSSIFAPTFSRSSEARFINLDCQDATRNKKNALFHIQELIGLSYSECCRARVRRERWSSLWWGMREIWSRDYTWLSLKVEWFFIYESTNAFTYELAIIVI